jgi:hypothetical protein
MRYYIIISGQAISTDRLPKGKVYRGKEIQAILTSREMAQPSVRAWLREAYPREKIWKPLISE